jgi:hypothetical protein
MKKLLLVSLCTLNLSLMAQIQNTALITPEAYSMLKKNGQLDPQTRYQFPPVVVTDTHLSAKDVPLSMEKAVCSCLTPLDSTFSVVQFLGGVAPDYRNDDSYSNPIFLPFTFNFYGTLYNSVFINNNGNISFVQGNEVYTADPFPDAQYNMIAPFWGDVDTRDSLSGLVYFKVTPTAMIVKWDHVGFYDTRSDLVNTFQLTISSGSDTLIPGGNNVSFCYGDMQWTTGAASGGLDGIGGFAATVGVNQGNGVDYFQVGTFDTLGLAFDGPYNSNDGVDFLDQQEIYFNLSLLGNVPPIIVSSYLCDTIDVYTGDTLEKAISIDSVVFVIGVTTPEIDQTVQATISCNQAEHFSYYLSMDTPTFKEYTCTFYTDNLLDNDTEQLHYITVVATDNWIPAASTTQTLVVRTNYEGSLSTKDLKKGEKLSIHPNPTEGMIYVKTNYSNGTDPVLFMIDITGKTVLSAGIKSNHQSVDVSHLKTGVYFATIVTNDGQKDVVKIICK